MPRKLAVWCFVAVLFPAGFALAALRPAAALEMRSGPSARVASPEVVDDDLYVASGRVGVDGRIRGDLIAAGGTIGVRGQVDGGVLALGGTLDLTGRVGTSVRAAGGSVLIGGVVGRDAVVAGGDVEILQEAHITRDLAAVGGTVVLRGAVDRNVQIAGGSVEIAGTIGGNALVRANKVVLLPSAVVRGNLIYSSEQPADIAQGTVRGQVSREPYPVRPVPSRGALRGFRIAVGIMDFLWMLILALVLVAVAPRAVQVPADVVRERSWASLGWGLLLLLAVPALIIAFVVMLIGIPIAVVLLLAHVLALFVSHAATGLAIGQRLLPRLKSRYVEVAIGVGIIAIATNLPVIGFFLRLLVVAVGLGAVVLVLWARRGPAAPAVPPAPVVPPVVA